MGHLICSALPWCSRMLLCSLGIVFVTAVGLAVFQLCDK